MTGVAAGIKVFEGSAVPLVLILFFIFLNRALRPGLHNAAPLALRKACAVEVIEM
ncbi:MAG: hypothetical protein ACI8RA_000574 [Chlamydiales bacterium]|jgi:hypothetical protein